MLRPERPALTESRRLDVPERPRLAFSPLTHDELHLRAEWHREACGYRCSAVARAPGFIDADLAYLLEQGRLARDYSDAAFVRCMGFLRAAS